MVWCFYEVAFITIEKRIHQKMFDQKYVWVFRAKGQHCELQQGGEYGLCKTVVTVFTSDYE